jgi:hypothetical protein
MNFTLIKALDESMEKKMISFFLKSKPYDFCCLPSRQLSVIKIKEYIRHLFANSQIYTSTNFFIALSVENETATIEFLSTFIPGIIVDAAPIKEFSPIVT